MHCGVISARCGALQRERFTLMIWSCALVEIGWSLLWAAALGLIALPLAAPLFLIIAGFSLMAFATTQTAKTASGRISPLAFFQWRLGSARRLFRQEKRHV